MNSHRAKFVANIECKDCVAWPDTIKSVQEWLKDKPIDQWKSDFERNGFIVIRNVLEEPELSIYKEIYFRLINGEIDTSEHRHDLGSNKSLQSSSVKENICQIMWPTLYVKHLDEGPAHERCLAVARIIGGGDMTHDFNFCISKGPHSNTETPWHCDQAYWLDMPDKRAFSFWIAITETTLDNGCMWFSPGSHKEPMRLHAPAAPGVHVLKCDGDESEGQACPLEPGDCTSHGGATRHYSRGNTTDSWRCGFVINYRPAAMVQYERDNDFDHGYRGFKKIIGTGMVHTNT